MVEKIKKDDSEYFDNTPLTLDKVPEITVDDLKPSQRITVENGLLNRLYIINQYLKSIYELSNFQLPASWPYMEDENGKKVLEACRLGNMLDCSCKYTAFFKPLYIAMISSYGMISQQFINKFGEYLTGSKVLEIFAGSGCLSYSLRSQGVDMIPTTLLHQTEEDIYYQYTSRKYWDIDIFDMDAKNAVQSFVRGVDYVLMSWQPKEYELDYECFWLMKKLNPKCKMIYIGDPKWSGSDKFHSVLHFEPIEELNKELINIDFTNSGVYLVS